jgi:ketosteroid isomerase-like protein
MRVWPASSIVIIIGLTAAFPAVASSIGDWTSAMQMTAEASPDLVARAAERGSVMEDRAMIAALDLAFQRAVKVNDSAAIDRILHRDYWLVLGNGTVVTREELIADARARRTEYEIQDEVPGTQTVRVWGDTAVVTAKLRIKGRRDGQTFSRTLWFSDTYVRTEDGWKYAFAQASLPLPEE